MTKWIVARFTLSGLSPTIDIVDVENDNVLIDDASMTELTSKPKVYVYEYTTYDPANNLYFEIDGGSELNDDERYPVAVNELNATEEIVEDNLDQSLSTTETNIIAEIDENETKIDALQLDITSLQTQIEFIYNIEGGKWERTATQMIFYKADNTTEVARFNLFIGGVPTTAEDNPDERVRV